MYSPLRCWMVGSLTDRLFNWLSWLSWTSFISFFFVVLDLNAFVKGAIEGFLSSLALMIFFAILPLVSIKSTHLPYVREIWLGLLSRLIRHENGAFRQLSSNRRTLRTPAFPRWTESILKTKLFEDNSITITLWFPFLSFPQTQIQNYQSLLYFQISPAQWQKPFDAFSNFSIVEWTGPRLFSNLARPANPPPPPCFADYFVLTPVFARGLNAEKNPAYQTACLHKLFKTDEDRSRSFVTSL